MLYYFVVFVVLLGVELLYFRVANYFNIIDKPNERSSHSRITLRGGGIVFYVGALVYFVISGFSFPWFMLGLTLIAGVSFVDDVRSVTQRVRLVVHFMAMLLMFYQWGMLALPWWYVVVALVVCTGIINAYNFMDGINGITEGYSLIVLGGLAYVNEWVIPFVDERMIYTMMVAVLVFGVFNFRRKAKCFAGDVGALVVCTGIINAYNFMDGINGITEGYSLIVLGGLAYVNEWVIPFVDERMIYTMMVAVLVFGVFNFRRKAKCFAGDVGAVSIAFVILFLLGRLILKTGDWSYIAFLAVYGVDSVLTIVHRLMLHENIGLPHRKHMYQLMANELKISHVVVSLLYMVVQAVIVAIYLAMPGMHDLCFGGSVIVLGVGYVLFMRKYFKLHLARMN